MTSVQNDPGGKYIQYRKFQFLDISDQLVRTELTQEHQDKMVPVTNDPEKSRQFFARFYSDIALSRSPVADTKAQIDQESQAVIEGFFDGKVSEETLSETFQDLFTRFSTACKEAGYPMPLETREGNQVMLDSFYSEFRRKILDEAVRRNDQEGQQYVTGDMNAQRNWKYYNADYYYQSEKALSAITDGVNELIKDRAYSGFTFRDYAAEGLNLYDNFNSAVSNNISFDEQFILDSKKAPPEGFRWFYQSGGDSGRVIQANGLIVTDANGNVEEYYDYRPTQFDPKDFRTATTWASYRDDKGTEHFVNTDFFYHGTKSDLRNLSALLNFTGGNKAQDAAMNDFLKNLQVYSQGYFSRFPQGGGVSLHA